MTEGAPGKTTAPSRVYKEQSSLIVGGSGFIGRHLAARLTLLGQQVRSVSVSDGFDIVKDKLPLDGISHVFHLAGRTGAVEAWEKPLSYIETNAYGTARVVDQCRTKGCSITFLSSFRNKEQGVEGAANPYVFSKIVAEQICSFYAARFGVNAVTLKVTNIYGPGQSRNFLIPQILSQLLDDREPVIVVQDLAPRRDYLHINDVIDAILLSRKAAPGSVLDVGSGIAHSVEEVIQLARNVSGIRKPYRAVGVTRHNEIKETVADTSAVFNATGWKSKISFDAGLSNLIESTGKCRAPST